MRNENDAGISITTRAVMTIATDPNARGHTIEKSDANEEGEQ
jgi:hypothetical protein